MGIREVKQLEDMVSVRVVVDNVGTLIPILEEFGVDLDQFDFSDCDIDKVFNVLYDSIPSLQSCPHKLGFPEGFNGRYHSVPYPYTNMEKVHVKKVDREIGFCFMLQNSTSVLQVCGEPIEVFVGGPYLIG